MSGKGIVAGVAFLVLMLVHGVAQAAITFVYPAPSSWVKRSDYLILKLNNPEITGVRINLNKVPGDLLNVGSPEYRNLFRDILIVKPSWDLRQNEVVVEAFKGAERVESATASVYLAPQGDASGVPPEYHPNVVHAPDVEKQCVDCHNMNPTQAQVSSTVAKENPCIGCHRTMLNVTFVHGPAGTFSCVYCHKGDAKSKYAVVKRDAELCNECHEVKAAEFRKRKYLHGPIAAGMCEVCHDPHGSANYAQLRLPVNDLCLSCHEVVRKSPHVVRTTTGEGHPVKWKKDPSSPASGREMSCVSCHNPHAGDVRYFFQNNQEDRMLLCQMCHNK